MKPFAWKVALVFATVGVAAAQMPVVSDKIEFKKAASHSGHVSGEGSFVIGTNRVFHQVQVRFYNDKDKEVTWVYGTRSSNLPSGWHGITTKRLPPGNYKVRAFLITRDDKGGDQKEVVAPVPARVEVK